MTDLVTVRFKSGHIEFAPAGAGANGPQAFTGAEKVVEAMDSLEKVFDRVREMGETFADKLKDLKFSSAEASFGVSVTAKGKFIVAEASAQASISVKLVFKGSD